MFRCFSLIRCQTHVGGWHLHVNMTNVDRPMLELAKEFKISCSKRARAREEYQNSIGSESIILVSTQAVGDRAVWQPEQSVRTSRPKEHRKASRTCFQPTSTLASWQIVHITADLKLFTRLCEPTKEFKPQAALQREETGANPFSSQFDSRNLGLPVECSKKGESLECGVLTGSPTSFCRKIRH